MKNVIKMLLCVLFVMSFAMLLVCNCKSTEAKEFEDEFKLEERPNAIYVEATIHRNFTDYTYNCPGIQDWKHIFGSKQINHYVGRQLTSWVLKNKYSNIELCYGKTTSGTFTSSISTSEGNSFNAGLQIKIFEIGVSHDKQVTETDSYSYSEAEMQSFKFIVTPETKGKYFSIGVNYAVKEYTVWHYLQKFKLFGQGKYEYKYYSRVEMPMMHYVSLNYKTETDGQVYCYLNDL